MRSDVRGRLFHSAVTAAGIGVLTFSSMAAYAVIDVLANAWRSDRAVSFALPAIGGVADLWALRVLVFSIVVFVGLALLFRRPPRVAAIVLVGLAISVVGTIVVVFMIAAQIGIDQSASDGASATAHLASISIATASRLLIVATPIVLVGALLLRSWHTARGLTEGPESL
jgi:hypothetical protein